MSNFQKAERDHFLLVANYASRILEHISTPFVHSHDATLTNLTFDVRRFERVLNPNGFEFDDGRRHDHSGDGDLSRGWIMIRTAIDEIIVAMLLQPICKGQSLVWTDGEISAPDFQGIIVKRLPVLPKKIPDRWKELLGAGVSIIRRRIAQDAIAPLGPPKCRLEVRSNIDGDHVLLDGVPYQVSDKAAEFLRALIDAKGEAVSMSDYCKTAHVSKLPQSIRDLIDKKTGGGSWLKREAWNAA